MMTNRALAVLFGVIVVLAKCSLQQQQTDPSECGIQKVKTNEVILRGRDAKPGAWPWHAAIYQLMGRNRKYVCGGTLISSRFLLTAVHCVKGDNGYVLSSRRMLVMLGVYNLDVPNSQTAQTHEVHQIYTIDNGDKLKNDIALIELATEVQFSDYVQPACISMEEDLTGQLGTVPGWGFTEHDKTSPTLKVAQLPVISTDKCLEEDRETFAFTLDRTLFCAGYQNGTGVCNGDSGGGLVFKRGDTWFLGGIVSYTAPRDDGSNLCRTEGFAGFTNVYRFLQWIREITKLTFSQRRVECRWRKWKLDGGSPPNGVLVGSATESPVFVGRTEFGGDLTLGQYLAASRQMFFVWGDVGRRATEFEVLTGAGFRWVKDYDGHVPYNAVAGGKTANGDKLFIGRHKYNDAWNAGVIVPFLEGLYIGVGRRFQKFTDYEVLVNDDPACQK